MSDAAESPYWKRAHRDWRVHAVAVVMLLAMLVYVLSENLALRPGVQRSPPAAPGGK